MMGQQTSDQSQLFYLFNLEGAYSGGSSLASDQSDRDAATRGHAREAGAVL